MHSFLYNRGLGQERDLKRTLYTSSFLVERLGLSNTLQGHEGCVNTVAFNSAGTKIISGSDDQQIKIWDANEGSSSTSTGKERVSFDSGHTNNVFQARFKPQDEASIITCAADGKVRLHCLGEDGTVQGGRCLGRHVDRAHKLALHPDQPTCFYSCGEDGIVAFFDLRCQKPHSILRCDHKRFGKLLPLPLYSIHCNPSCPWQFVVAGADDCVRVYDQRQTTNISGSPDETSQQGRLTSVMSAEPVRALTPAQLRTKATNQSRHHVTCAMFSLQGEVLASYGSEAIYRFKAEGVLKKLSSTAQTDTPKRKRGRDRSGLMGSSMAKKSSSGDRAGPGDASSRLQDESTVESNTDQMNRNLQQEEASPRLSEPRSAKHQSAGQTSQEQGMAPGRSGLREGEADDVHPETQDPSRAAVRQPVNANQPNQAVGGASRLQRTAESHQPLADSDTEPRNNAAQAAFAEMIENTWRDISSNMVSDLMSREYPDENDPSDEEEICPGQDSWDDELAGNREDYDVDPEIDVDDYDEEDVSLSEDSDDSTALGYMTEMNSSSFGQLKRLAKTQYETLEHLRSAAGDDEDEVVQFYEGHHNERTVKGVSFLGHNDEYVMSGSDCGHIFIWRTSDGRLLRYMKGDEDTVNCLVQHPSEPLAFATSGIEDDIKMWSPVHGKPITLSQQQRDQIRKAKMRTPQLSLLSLEAILSRSIFG